MVKFNSAKLQLLLHQPNMKAMKACQGTAEGRDAWGEEEMHGVRKSAEHRSFCLLGVW